MNEILLCTHDPILVKSLYGILRDEGHDVTVADHLALAVQMVLLREFYALIIDAKPFGLSVDDALCIVKTVAPEVPVVIVGGAGSSADVLNIQLPVDLEELRSVINTMHQVSKIHTYEGGV